MVYILIAKMLAHNVLTNNYSSDRRHTIYMPRRQTSAVVYPPPAAKEVWVPPPVPREDPRVGKLERDMKEMVNTRDKEIQLLKMQVVDLGKKSETDSLLLQVESLKRSMKSKSDEMDMLKASVNRIVSSKKEEDTKSSMLRSAPRFGGAVKSDTPHMNVLTVGDQTNIPSQPDAVKSNGVYKVAPLALAVNGAVVLHDIGYSNSSELLPIAWEPHTARLVIKTGK